jgi:4'-phosphopantetheinyl transferase
MWFAFYCRAPNHCFIRHNLVNWFMNRNTLISQSIVWHKMPDPDLTVSSFTDHGTLVNSDLNEILSNQEKEQSATFLDPSELRHYIARRCFQRLFLAEILGTNVAPDKLDLIHRRDSQPRCSNAPDLNLSFSSSGTTAIACASTHYSIGIDIERFRTVENVIALAKRYFTPEEAADLAKMRQSEQNRAFLHYWTAKEAGLKAIGKGVVFGLNTFKLTENGENSYEIHGPQNNSLNWNLQYLEIIPRHIVALVKMNRVGKV